MKRMVAVAAVMVLSVSSVLPAQGNPFVGTWRLNTAKTKFSFGPAPRDGTLTIEAQGDGVKVSSEGTAADGARFAWSYTANYDGKDNPISGTGAPLGADIIALKRIHRNQTEATWKKAGKVVLTYRWVVSRDGKVTTITAKGTGPNGQPVSMVMVGDKQ